MAKNVEVSSCEEENTHRKKCIDKYRYKTDVIVNCSSILLIILILLILFLLLILLMYL